MHLRAAQHTGTNTPKEHAPKMAATITTRPPEVNTGVTTFWLPMSTPWPSSPGCESSFFVFRRSHIAAWYPSEARMSLLTSIVGFTGECVSTLSPGQVITVVDPPSPYPTTMNTSIVYGIPVNGWAFQPSSTPTSRTSSPPTSRTGSPSPTSAGPTADNAIFVLVFSVFGGCIVLGFCVAVAAVLGRQAWKKREGLRERVRDPRGDDSRSTAFNVDDTETVPEQKAGNLFVRAWVHGVAGSTQLSGNESRTLGGAPATSASGSGLTGTTTRLTNAEC
ncbi:hypothetical protein MAPG_10262 [Magnaporthiopsis poae ATCC 64411]|uniref:Uncharacterized protein n=1 Tax=Magnaporthiopsis poae (strain ATCC 64411 / 73-15) TaxID=644358 RepID=A0A0C4EC48_MAGP6|nr:hypothetical protein MAPG_10262 [Magnaporthiopsis poae ATCC 64411]